MLNILHVAYEYKKRVGGLGAVTVGLLPALANKKSVNMSIVTPYYDVYDGYYADIEQIASVLHIYEGVIHCSLVFRVCSDVVDGAEIYHYLIKPAEGSPVKEIFKIEEQRKLYLPSDSFNSHDRMKYFNGAVASLIRTPNVKVPNFDIVHLHTWHTSLTGCLVKEFENLKNYQNLIQGATKQLRKIPHVFFTIHMLWQRQHGYITDEPSVRNLFASIGLSNNFERTFSEKAHIRGNFINLHVLGLAYADYVNIVSRSVIKEINNGEAHGLDDVFKKLQQNQRFVGITNGIPYKDWDATNHDNLQEYAFDLTKTVADKQRIKNYVASKYPQLNPDKKWFLFVGRFAYEKGIDLLPAALEEIRNQGGHFIVMGIQVTIDKSNPVSIQIEAFKSLEDVLVIDDPQEQQIIGKFMRAACEFTLIPSNNETCGIVPMEAQACSSIPIASEVQGLPDTVIPLKNNFDNGTGFLFNYDLEMRHENFKKAISEAVSLYDSYIIDGKLGCLLSRLVSGAKRYDWDGYTSQEYIKAYHTVVNMELLTYNKIRALPSQEPILNQFKGHAAQVAQLKAFTGKILQIGFNKCGTQSFVDFLWSHKIRTMHYGNKERTIGEVMYNNHINSKPLLTGYEEFTGFFDMECIYADPPIYIAQTLFKELDRQYPGSKFILNTRDREAWVKSRCKHIDVTNGKGYVEVLCEKYKLTKEELTDRWRQEWDEHHKVVLEYFKDRPQDLLIYNIEKDPPQKICEFFKDYFNLNPAHFKHLNKESSILLPKMLLTT